MKKFIAIILSAGMFLISQVSMAANLNGLVTTEGFENEMDAINQAKTISSQIEAGTNRTVLAAATNRCQHLRGVDFEAENFTVKPVWVEKEAGFVKEYVAEVGFSYTCDLEIEMGSL